jgi:aspartyl-tRNA synthetase
MQLDFLGDLKRTHTCGELRAANDGQQVILMGWVNRRRDLGTVIFVDLRDRTGFTQVVFNAEQAKALHEKASALRSEFVIAVKGAVKKRDGNTINKNVATGEVEVVASELLLLNESKTPPFSPSDDANSTVSNEETRLKYRYIDLRRPQMQANIELRHRVALAIRNDLSARGFFEIETPFMTRSTPEGARDYLVPSRVHPGQFYALPQSPQLFKQILMISGFDKYFQIVRCFRDEDLRADRQPEFTQIDLEMTFPQQDRVFEVVEGFLTAAFKAAGHELKTPFPRMTYDEAIAQYGSDKPDLRLPAMTDVRGAFTPDQLATLQINPSLPVVCVRTPKVGELSRKERDDLKILVAAKPGIKTIDDFKRLEKSFPEAVAKVREKCGAQADDFLLLVVGAADANIKPAAVSSAAGSWRLALAQKFAEKHKLFERTGNVSTDYRWLWVTDFPMFEYDDENKRWVAAHHPFTSPHEKDLIAGRLESDPGAVRALAYDAVLNGIEMASGSIRIHQQEIQRQIFKAMGIEREEAQQRFGFFLDALEYGTPPHGGIAMGLDRLVMVLAGGESLREVIPFPKTAQAKDLMVDAPTPVSNEQLQQLGISVKTK